MADTNIYEEQFKFLQISLAAKPNKNPLVDEFNALINGGFMDFARKESANSAEADMLVKLQETAKRFELAANFPFVHGKRIGAVAGGFSAGKSAFINSFLLNKNPNERIKLPEGMERTTAIPCYITSSENTGVIGHTPDGRTFDIPNEMFARLTPDFLKSFNFDIKQIIPYITVSSPLDEKLFSNICLMDTPGYNPGEAGFAASDLASAHEQAANADFLIWLVWAKDGTITRSDISFLKDIIDKKENLDLYIVVSRADDLPPKKREPVLETMQSVLDDEGINYKGICAYTSSPKEVENNPTYPYKRIKLAEFLEQKNTVCKTFDILNGAIDEVFDSYKTALEEQKSKYKKNAVLIATIALDMQSNLDYNNAETKKSLKSIDKFFDTKKVDEFLAETETLRRKFKDLISRLENYDQSDKIDTLAKLEGYLKDSAPKAGAEKAKFEAYSLACGMIARGDYSLDVFTELCTLGYCAKEPAEHVITSITAKIDYANHKESSGEKDLKKICADIVQKARELAQSGTTNVTFFTDKFFSDFIDKGFFKNLSVEKLAKQQTELYKKYKTQEELKWQ